MENQTSYMAGYLLFGVLATFTVLGSKKILNRMAFCQTVQDLFILGDCRFYPAKTPLSYATGLIVPPLPLPEFQSLQPN